MKWMLIAAAVLLAVIVFDQANMTDADRRSAAAREQASPIGQSVAESLAEEFMKKILKDPDSMKTDWFPVVENRMRSTTGQQVGEAYGYRLSGTINAKNSFGGYGGKELFTFIFFEKQIVFAGRHLQDGTLEELHNGSGRSTASFNWVRGPTEDGPR